MTKSKAGVGNKMKLINAENLLDDYAFKPEEPEEDGSFLTKDVKSFYRESVEYDGVAPEIKVALVQKSEDGYQIIKIFD